MDAVETQPELSLQVAEPLLVVFPRAEELDAAVDAPLDDGPAPAVGVHVAEDREAAVVEAGVYREDAAGVCAAQQYVCARYVAYKRKKSYLSFFSVLRGF